MATAVFVQNFKLRHGNQENNKSWEKTVKENNQIKRF